MAERIIPESKSEWDGREKFFEQWDEDRRCIRNCLLYDDYQGALDFLSTWVVNFSGYSDLEVSDVRGEINELIARYMRESDYEDELYVKKAAETKQRIKNRFYDYMADLTKVMNKLRMLIPMTEIISQDDPGAVADNYERLVYNEVCRDQDKHIPELDAYDAAYPWVDDNLKAIITRQRWLNEKKKKDSLWIFFGPPGAGKSTLAHHAHNFYTGGKPGIENVSLDKQEFSITIDNSLSKPRVADRVTHYDEANVTKREAMSNWNKDMIDLYESIRGDNGFHLWCNPSAQYLEQKFIGERVNALIYIYEGTGKLRRYAFIPRKKIMEFLEKKENLKTGTMDKYAKDYAINYGWFRDYPDDDFRRAYEAKKTARMALKRARFRERWSEEPDAQNLQTMMRRFKIKDPRTVTRVIDEMTGLGLLPPEEIKGLNGEWRLSEDQVKSVEDYMRAKPAKRGRPRKEAA